MRSSNPQDEIFAIRFNDDVRLLYRYRISKTLIVGPDDVYVLDPTDQPTLTLVTCYPFEFVGDAPATLHVQAQLVEEEARASGGRSATNHPQQ